MNIIYPTVRPSIFTPPYVPPYILHMFPELTWNDSFYSSKKTYASLMAPGLWMTLSVEFILNGSLECYWEHNIYHCQYVCHCNDSGAELIAPIIQDATPNFKLQPRTATQPLWTTTFYVEQANTTMAKVSLFQLWTIIHFPPFIQDYVEGNP